MANSPESDGYPARGRARFAQAVLVVIAIVTAMDVHVSKLLLEPMKAELGLSDAQAGFINVTASSLAYALCAIPAGLLADRLNRVRLLLFAMLLWAVGLGSVALSGGLAVLLLGKFILGAALALTYTSAMSLFSDYFSPDRRATATASFPVGQTLGGAGAVLVGGLGLSALTGMVVSEPVFLQPLTPWRGVTLVFGVCSLLLVPLLLTVREPPRMERSAAKGAKKFRILWDRRAELLPLYGGMMFLSGLASGVMVWSVPALMRLYGQSPADLATWLAPLSLVVGIAGMIVGGRLVQARVRTGDMRELLAPAITAALVGSIGNFMAVMPNVIGFAFLLTLSNFTYAIAISVPVIAINYRIPNDLRGLAMAGYVVLFAIVGGIAAPMVGAATSAFGGDHMLGAGILSVGLTCSFGAYICFRMAARVNSPSTPDKVAS
ncbi:MAG: MFS transporter [Sphingopyxis sp.]|uniref:MFS transporter n=1 Tax=Sphingopyxis sp. TaxID=1908224 RepID=UPI002ABB0823|nr:MFS transporter [Sphingopyxis sp.]MDZ3833109.1 MFS transporter [Sphingopyxis sp.]